ncbi:MAG TPA: hypothetical protein VHN15_10810 [Thermoanaerobaculia bacterium]|nr:hypothetical protein [Thermoanaerobaculia bacterium]
MRQQKKREPTEHPAAAAWESLILGTLTDEEHRKAMAHLLLGCETCRAAVRPILEHRAQESRESVEDEELDPAVLAVYSDAVDRAIEAVLLHGRHAPLRTLHRRRALACMKERGVAGASPEVFGSYAVYEASLIRARELEKEDPREMVRAAWNAVQMASRIDGEEDGFSAAQIADFQARAAAEYADALRIVGQLPESDLHLQRAYHLAAVGTGRVLLSRRLQEVQSCWLEAVVNR